MGLEAGGRGRAGTIGARHADDAPPAAVGGGKDAYVQAAVLACGWRSDGCTASTYMLEGLEGPAGGKPLLWSALRPSGHPPPPRAMHTAVLAATAPGPGSDVELSGAAAAVDLFAPGRVWEEPPPMELLVFGGWDAVSGGFHNDTWSLDLARLTWAEVTPRSLFVPEPRASHTGEKCVF